MLVTWPGAATEKPAAPIICTGAINHVIVIGNTGNAVPVTRNDRIREDKARYFPLVCPLRQ